MIIVAGLVTAGWLLAGVVLGSQTALGLTLQGNPVALSESIRASVMSTAPWIPPTIIAIGMAKRFPVTRSSWKRTLPIHLVAVFPVGWVGNVGVVAGFWLGAGTFNGWTTLARQAAFWTTVQFTFAAFVYTGSVALTQVTLYLREARERELRLARTEGQLARARATALSAQLRPHFLFNTLHTIGQLWRSGRHDEADAMLDSLGALFQRVQAVTDRSGISLDEELSMVEEYLSIEQARFSDRLSVRVQATPEARSCLVPPLLLQPLVENAIRHGISVSPAAGCVGVEARVEDGSLVIDVTDDGPGFDDTSPRAGTGTGLSNTRDRLSTLFPGRHVLSVTTPDDGGTQVRVVVPAIDESEELLA